MVYGLMAGAIGLAIGMVLMNFSYNKSGQKKETFFLVSVVLNILIQCFLVYEYVIYRGGFVVKGCVYGVSGALLLGALVLWTSKMLFSFSHEGFRVLLGVSAVVAGCLGGCGIDMIVAFNSGNSLIHSNLAVFFLCIGSISIMISDICIILKNFSLKELKLYSLIYQITTFMGIILIMIGAVL